MKNVYFFHHVIYPLFLLDLMKLDLSRHIFENYSNIKFHKNPSSGRRVFPCEWTDILDEANSHVSQLFGKGRNEVHPFS